MRVLLLEVKAPLLDKSDTPRSVENNINDKNGGSVSMVDYNLDGKPETVTAKAGEKVTLKPYNRLIITELNYDRTVDSLDKEKSLEAKNVVNSII